ncbi:MAG: hypothetical protein ACK4IS_09725 [Erythrobacter sp.]
MTMVRLAALFAHGETSLPRFRELGDLTLDLLHHDGRIEDRWLALDPAEFELLWRLAKAPGRCLSDQALAGWVRDQGDAELALMRLSEKLAAHHLGYVLARDKEGGLCLAPRTGLPATT